MSERAWVVLLGDFSNERVDVASIGRDFGWSVVRIPDTSALAEMSRSRNVVAVLIHEGSLSRDWRQTLRKVREAAPRARIIISQKAGQARNRSEMIDSGVFGVLLSPLAHSEVRQSLGFVWASKITPMRSVQQAVTQGASAA